MDIQNNIFAVVPTIVNAVLDSENTDKNVLVIRKRMREIELDIERYDVADEAYMKCLETLEASHIDKESSAYCELLSAWEDKKEDERYAGQDLYEASVSLNNWRKVAIKKTVLAMGITDEHIQNMFVELAIKQMANKQE